MSVETQVDEMIPRPSRLVAEALVGRHGPQLIAVRASALGYSSELTRAMIAACSATAIDRTRPPHRRPFARPD